ncbi:MAG: sodium-dependent dicarboxylate transporter 2/3/5 [Myxococcota bacterium]|jgi:sodium-dependent dicarboxylate transporter 2/3/5
MRTTRLLSLASGPLLAAISVGAALFAGLDAPAAWTAGVAAWCVAWWISEPIPIPATSLIPFAAFPAIGVLDHKTVASAYGHTLILLLLGGFILSTAMAKSGAHRRLALGIVTLVGGGGRRLVLGFMLACALCSMWISNTATTLMLLPVVGAVLERADKRLTTPLLLGLAYSASIGGLGTPVGTPPNVIFMGIYREATGTDVSFLQWMSIGIPAVAILLPLAWLWLTRNLADTPAVELPTLPPWRSAERRVLAVFAITALLWVTRTAPFGGWSGALSMEGVGDSTVALAAVVALFVLPDGEGGPMLDWKTAREIPWGLLLLFGGGIAIARAFGASGLSEAIGGAMTGLMTLPTLLLIGAVCLSVTFLTEVTSNTATTTLLMPVLAAAGLAAGIDPALLMIPAALSASCAFMLPVATAPNAIVFGTGKVTTRTMAREGLVLNLVGAVCLTGVCWLLL